MNEREKYMKSCDQCKTRKVRCSGAGHQRAISCLNCARRGEICHFSLLRKPHRRSPRTGAQAIPVDSPSMSDDTVQPLEDDDFLARSETSEYYGLQELYIDRLLTGPRPASTEHVPSESLQTLGVFGSEYSLTFFSEARLASLEHRLGHDGVSRIRSQMATIIAQRMKTVEKVPPPAVDSDRRPGSGANNAFTTACIQAYFEHVHPMHPFLDRLQVETLALGPQLEHKLATDKAWSALFYSILALGCQYHDGGSYQPANNTAWNFFSAALGLFPDLLITKANLTVVQAITSMAIFASNVSCMQFEYVMVSEGVKKAQILGYNRSSAPGNDPRNRTFWVLFCLEKTMAFTMAKSSFIMDADISSALPVHEPSSGEFNSFLAFIKLSRLFSRIYSSLHSVSVRGRPRNYFKATISRLKNELEQWRTNIPPPFRPALESRIHGLHTNQDLGTCVRLHYGYHSTMLHLNRASLHLKHPDVDASNTTTDIMRTTRSILELTRYIDVQPYTPLWVLAAVPLTALFVLFDLVIENPSHPDTSSNLALLDIGSGHFSHIEYASKGSLPGSILSEFAHIARCYVRETCQSHSENPRTGPGAFPSLNTVKDTNVPGDTHMLQATNLTPQLGDQVDLGLHQSLTDWCPQDDEPLSARTDVLDLFGSYSYSWDEEWLFRTVPF